MKIDDLFYVRNLKYMHMKWPTRSIASSAHLFHGFGLVSFGGKDGAFLGFLGCGLVNSGEVGRREAAGILCLKDGVDGQRLFLLAALKSSGRTKVFEAAEAIL